MSDDPYVYAGTNVLRNKLDIRNAARLDAVERQLTTQRAREGIPTGDFDLDHLSAIHRHLFQDIYEWAGEVRTVVISKGENTFQPPRFIPTGMADVHKRIVDAKFLSRLSKDGFAKKAGEIMADINYVHPFREGNGRTQLQFLKLLAAKAGHHLHLTRLDGEKWIAASIAAHTRETRLMSDAIKGAITGKDQDRGR